MTTPISEIAAVDSLVIANLYGCGPSAAYAKVAATNVIPKSRAGVTRVSPVSETARTSEEPLGSHVDSFA